MNIDGGHKFASAYGCLDYYYYIYIHTHIIYTYIYNIPNLGLSNNGRGQGHPYISMSQKVMTRVGFGHLL